MRSRLHAALDNAHPHRAGNSGQLLRGSIKVQRLALVSVSCVAGLLFGACKPTTAGKRLSAKVVSDTVANDDTHVRIPFAHGVTMFVSALNCELNAVDASRLNRLAAETGVNVEVAFVGVSANDTVIAQKARHDLGLIIPSRVMRDGELAQYKSIGIARMPMALVIKGKQLSTIISGETATKTLGLIEAAFSPKVAR